MTRKIALVAKGIFERSDSIAFDCLWQYDRLRELYPENNKVRVFAENIHERRYADRPLEAIDRLWPWINQDDDALVIYHFCDGWPAFEDRMLRSRARLVVRWHNNTPPWFFAPFSSGPTASTIRGFQRVLRLAERSSTEFWVNSVFSARQLAFLGVPESRIHVVYPASRYLSRALPRQPGASRGQRGAVDVLFVGRVTPHKGHKHLIGVCALAQRLMHQKVALHVVGRSDPSMQCYVDELVTLARKLSVPLSMHGEVEQAGLQSLYERCDVFLALSEHEGFGLPLFEAMRMGIPVVAFRTTAIGDLLGGHPLSVDVLDYREIALRVIAALDPRVRELIAAWQREQVLTQYDAEIVTRQLRDGIAGQVRWPAGAPGGPCLAVEQAVEALRARLWVGLEKTAATLTALREIPKDDPDRLVTRHDIAAYSALLGASLTPNLLDAALGGIASDRRLLGPPLRLVRRLAVGIQSGLVSAMSMLDANASARHERIARSLAQLQTSIDAIENARPPQHSGAADHGRSRGEGSHIGNGSLRATGKQYADEMRVAQE